MNSCKTLINNEIESYPWTFLGLKKVPRISPFFLSENHLILHSKKQKSSENQLIFRTFLLFALICCTPSGIRTLDPLIKSQLLYQLS